MVLRHASFRVPDSSPRFRHRVYEPDGLPLRWRLRRSGGKQHGVQLRRVAMGAASAVRDHVTSSLEKGPVNPSTSTPV